MRIITLVKMFQKSELHCKFKTVFRPLKDLLESYSTLLKQSFWQYGESSLHRVKM